MGFDTVSAVKKQYKQLRADLVELIARADITHSDRKQFEARLAAIDKKIERLKDGQ